MNKQTKKIPVKKSTCNCPFCNAELVSMNLPVCQACKVTIVYCADCGEPLSKGKQTCPNCGSKVTK
jgi:transcription elongation factor Elf1